MLTLAAGIILFASCKKDYECTYSSGGFTLSQSYPDLTKDEAAVKEVDCNNLGGTWSVQ